MRNQNVKLEVEVTVTHCTSPIIFCPPIKLLERTKEYKIHTRSNQQSAQHPVSSPLTSFLE